MPTIQPYEERVSAQGQINSQAEPNAFGAQLGTAISSVAHVLHQQVVQDDLTKVYTDMSAARAQFTADLRDASNSSSPGDQTFTPRMVEGMQNYFNKLAPNYKTSAGQREFARLSADLTSTFTARAIEQQSHLAAQGAINDDRRQNTSLGQAVFNDPSQVDGAIAQRKSAIDNPNGLYARISQAERDKLKFESEMELRLGAAMGEATKTPEKYLGKISPETLQKYRLTARVAGALDSSVPVTNAKVNSLQPVVQQNAEKYGVDANILSAQIMQESGGNTASVSSKGAKGVSQFIDETAKRYSVDVNNDASSIRGQANYMADLLKMFGGDYKKALAGYNWGEGNVQKAIDKWGVNWLDHAPGETKNYVGKILSNAGIQASTGEAVLPGNIKPIAIGDKNFDALPWTDQYRVLQTAQAQVNANQIRDQQKIAFAEQQRKRAEDAEMQAMLPKLQDNQLLPQDVLNATSMDAPTKLQMLRLIEVKANRMDNTDPKVMTDTLGKVLRGEMVDPSAPLEMVGHGLSLTDAQKLQAIINGKGTALGEARKTFLATAKSQITGTQSAAGIQDPEGDKQYNLFFQEFSQVVEEKQKAGVPVSELLNPKSREFVGWLVDKYKRGPQARIQATADVIKNSASGARPNVTPRLANETPDQYLARTGGK